MNEPTPPKAAQVRRKALLTIGAVVALAALGYALYWTLVLNHYETTDNAYVQGQVVQITPQVGGTVVAIGADETDRVKAGQVLVRLDPADAKVALEQAEAQLAQSVREVRVLYANNSTLAAQVALREAELARAQAEVQRATEDVARRQPLVATGAVGQEDLSHAQAQLTAARHAVAAAQSGVAAAREQLASNQSMTEGTSVDQHPGVQRAAARLRETWLALRRVELPAPQDGVVARRNVQLGQRVQTGAPLMTLVGADALWVDANFKEGQLRRIRVGQKATLTADVYGSRVEYHGTVAGLGAGTGAAFALLPAQNATGNWIKVVQRVPVRIVLDAKEVAAHPLRVGLSMEVSVDVSGSSDALPVADAPRTNPPAQTTVFDALNRDADAAVQRVIQAHGGRAAKAPAR